MKIEDLFLPYFWDEAWSYMPAVFSMAESGPSLIPGHIDPELYRGHPTLFYFLTATWMNWVGDSIFVMKLFPLLVSLLLIWESFRFTKTFFSKTAAIVVVPLLCVQSVFIAQSSMVLPEMLLALFTILAASAFLKRQRVWTVIWTTLALFTKESAIVIYGCIGLFELIRIGSEKQLDILNKLKQLAYLLVPALLISIFFIAQKIIVGWVFFPEHLNMMSLSEFTSRIEGYTTYLFIYMGRNLLTFVAVLSIIGLFIWKRENLKHDKFIIGFMFSFILLYILFSSLNFYSGRYMLSVIPFFVILCVHLIYSALKYMHWSIPTLIFIGLFINNIHFTVSKRGDHDHTLGFRDLTSVQHQMITFCEENLDYEDQISTHFLMHTYLTDSRLGYLSKDSSFINASSNFLSPSSYVIFSSSEIDRAIYNSIKQKAVLVQRYESNDSWCEMYRYTSDE